MHCTYCTRNVWLMLIVSLLTQPRSQNGLKVGINRSFTPSTHWCIYSSQLWTMPPPPPSDRRLRAGKILSVLERNSNLLPGNQGRSRTTDMINIEFVHMCVHVCVCYSQVSIQHSLGIITTMSIVNSRYVQFRIWRGKIRYIHKYMYIVYEVYNIWSPASLKLLWCLQTTHR